VIYIALRREPGRIGDGR